MQNFCVLGALPLTPYASSDWGFAPKLPASGGWRLCSQAPKTAPIANFWQNLCVVIAAMLF